MQIKYHFLNNNPQYYLRTKCKFVAVGTIQFLKQIQFQNKKTTYRIPKEFPIASHQGSINCHNSPTKFPLKNYLNVVENNDKLNN